jgi:hypothetical protein
MLSLAPWTTALILIGLQLGILGRRTAPRLAAAVVETGRSRLLRIAKAADSTFS